MVQTCVRTCGHGEGVVAEIQVFQRVAGSAGLEGRQQQRHPQVAHEVAAQRQMHEITGGSSQPTRQHLSTSCGEAVVSEDSQVRSGQVRSGQGMDQGRVY